MEFLVLKTRIKISPLFFAVLTAFLVMDKNGIAPLTVVFSFLHELGHFLALLCAKTRASEIKISVFGIEIFLPKKLSTAKKAAVLMAGFAVNFILAAIFFIFNYPLFAYINLIIGLATVFPTASTDGGGVLKLLLEEISFEKGEKLFKVISITLGGLLSMFVLPVAVYTKNYYLLIAVIYIFIFAIK